MKYNKMV